ncbi:hypothetical protein F2Q69_00044175 [Brassica cretica]|uniref:Uncharacterized protein n=1 Tax=Brassica cretica TaxID=69181 RepID=A0A8S9NRU5_BRACR|nr:hypothetical protein F2Q69_00044175 [Brassica cretica]
MTCLDDLLVSLPDDLLMMRQLHALYGEWLLKDYRWDFVVDNVKGTRIIFWGKAEMMQVPYTPSIHVTSDRQVRNLLEITKTHGVWLCVSSRSKVETVSEFRAGDDEADETDECFQDDDDDLEDDGEEDDGEEDDGEEDAGMKRTRIVRITVFMERLKMRMRKMMICVLKISKRLKEEDRMVLLQNIQVNENSPCDNMSGARIIFFGEGSTHAELLAMAQENYNLDMSTKSVEITYSLPAEMMQAPDIPPIHVETVSEFREENDEADEAEEYFEYDDDDLVEDENHDGVEDDGEEDDGEEDAGISIVAEADENGEDYSVYRKV